MNQYMNVVQKGIVNNTISSKHQLLLDKTVIVDWKSQQTNLAWIDYKKAYAST